MNTIPPGAVPTATFPLPPTPIINADRPLALFPVRLETRFFPTATGSLVIRIRVYPDKVHIDTHEPGLTADEADWGRHYWESSWRAGNDEERKRVAWRQLAERFDPQRAAWIAWHLRPVNPADRPASPQPPDQPLAKPPKFPQPPQLKTRAESWTRPAWTNVLPDRWIALGYVNGVVVAVAQGANIPDPLVVGPSPDIEINPSDDQPPLDAGIKWMIDFDEAVGKGMGLQLSLPPQFAGGLDRLIVLGVKASLNSDASAARLAELFDAHNYTSGLSFLRQGTPTNNTADAASGYSSFDPGYEISYQAARGEALVRAGDESNGDALTAALGLKRDVFARISNADAKEQLNARQMNTALWPATWGYFLQQMMSGVFAQAEADGNIAWGRRHFINYVRAGGPLPAVRCGRQPYGILPVTSLDLWKPRVEDGAQSAKDAGLVAFLIKLRETWLHNVDKVPKVGVSPNPDRDMIQVLRMDAVSSSYVIRGVMGRHYFQHLWPFQFVDLNATGWWNKHAELVNAGLQKLGILNWKTRLNGAVFAGAHVPLKGAFVQPGVVAENTPLTPNYIDLLGSSPDLATIRNETFPDPKPNSLLYFLLRHSMLLEYANAASSILIDKQLMTPAQRREPELVNIEVGQPAFTVWRQLTSVVPGVSTQPLEVHLHQLTSFADPKVAQLGEFRESLKQLKTLGAAELERLLAATLDLCSYRLDAWITSMATRRMALMRQANPAGVYLGGYGWVENLRPGPARQFAATVPEESVPPVFALPNNPGFVHTPSLTQAATVAVLRSGHLTHANSNTANLLSIDLSSERVRLAKWLLEGVRQGQPLGALLGYRFERGLHEGHPGVEMDRFIKPFRELAPLVAKKLEKAEGQPVEAIAANNVVDGLKLHRLWKSQGPQLLMSRPDLPKPTMQPEYQAVLAELAALDGAVDAVSDALLAESIHQTVKGNPTRASATLDAVARGDAPPPELEVVETPRSGIASTHRLIALFSGDAATPVKWPLGRHPYRAQAEPRLNAWVARLLGNPANVRCVIERLEPETGRVLETKEIRISELQLSPLDFIYAAQSSEETRQSELEQRIQMQIKRKPGGFAPDSLLRLNPARNPAWSAADVSCSEFFELIRTARGLITGARAIEARDLVQGEAADQSSVDLTELQQRSVQAVKAFRQAQAELQQLLVNPTQDRIEALREAIFRLAHFGIQGAIPLSAARNRSEDLKLLQTQARSIEKEAGDRFARIQALEDGFNPSVATIEERLNFHVARVREVFGPAFVVSPRFKPANVAELGKAFADSTKIQDNDPMAAVTWFQRAARVRDGMSRFDEALRFAEALGAGESFNLKVGQLPYRENDRWVALPLKEGRPIPGGILSLVAQLPDQFDVRQPLAGLLIDEWVEVVPNASETTGVVFQYDQPDAAPPQAILVAVPPDNQQFWTIPSLQKVLSETFDLAKIRAVDPDALDEIEHFLPALYLAFNAEGDTVSSDLTRLTR